MVFCWFLRVLRGFSMSFLGFAFCFLLIPQKVSDKGCDGRVRWRLQGSIGLRNLVFARVV